MEETIKAVIVRGYATQEEQTALVRAIGYQRILIDNEERIWCVVLDETHFLFCNWPLKMARAPRSPIGMVGVYAHEGGDRVMVNDATMDVFVNRAGQASIDYWNELKKRQEPQEE